MLNNCDREYGLATYGKRLDIFAIHRMILFPDKSLMIWKNAKGTK